MRFSAAFARVRLLRADFSSGAAGRSLLAFAAAGWNRGERCGASGSFAAADCCWPGCRLRWVAVGDGRSAGCCGCRRRMGWGRSVGAVAGVSCGRRVRASRLKKGRPVDVGCGYAASAGAAEGLCCGYRSHLLDCGCSVPGFCEDCGCWGAGICCGCSDVSASLRCCVADMLRRDGYSAGVGCLLAVYAADLAGIRPEFCGYSVAGMLCWGLPIFGPAVCCCGRRMVALELFAAGVRTDRAGRDWLCERLLPCDRFRDGHCLFQCGHVRFRRRRRGRKMKKPRRIFI